MKKIITLISLLCTLLPLFPAAAQVRTEPIMLQAGFGDMLDIYITEIPAQSSSYLEGMPFNIEDTIVMAGSGRGRTIAYFDIMANTNCRIKVNAKDLVFAADPSDPDSTGGGSSLSYVLDFDYEVAYTDANGSTSFSPSNTGFTVNSTSGDEMRSFDLYSGGNRMPDTILSIRNGIISFKFDSATSDRIHNPNADNGGEVSPGLYKGEVTVELEAMT